MSGQLTILRNNHRLAAFIPKEDTAYSAGTKAENDLVIPEGEDSSVEGVHAKFIFAGSLWWIIDCSLKSGVTAEGRKILKEPVLADTLIKLGNYELLLKTTASDPANKVFTEEKTTIFDLLVKQLNIRKLQKETLSDEELEEKAREILDGLVNQEAARLSVLSPDKVKELKDEIIQDLLKLGPLEPLIADNDITEIMVIDYRRIYVEKKGKIELSDRFFRDPSHLLRVIERIVAPLGRRIDESSPLVDARLKDGSRVNAVIPPITPDGACLTIRKFGKSIFTVDKLMAYGSMTNEMARFIEACVKLRKNIVVSGGTGSGKTSLLNAISMFISGGERIVTIEDSLELKLQQPHVVRMEARPANAEGRGEVSIRSLVKNSLRMRPDRIVVGECRGGEALDMLQAMNTGHDGSLTTVHANTPVDAVSRLETLVLMAGMDLPLSAVRNQIVSAVDLIVQTSRLSDGSRKVISITEVVELKNNEPVLNEIFRYRQDSVEEGTFKVRGEHIPVAKPTFFSEFKASGIHCDENWFIKKG